MKRRDRGQEGIGEKVEWDAYSRSQHLGSLGMNPVYFPACPAGAQTAACDLLLLP